MKNTSKGPKRRILISVTDKRYLEKFERLTNAGWEILSTGGTADKFEILKIPRTTIEDYTGFPQLFNGRLKTIHPKVAGGILAKRTDRLHMQQAVDHGIPMIDVVVVNLYDFKSKPGIENIDIGGPYMLRSAAKNAASVTVVVRPEDYDLVIDELLEKGTTSPELRARLALITFEHTKEYDEMIAKWMKKELLQGRNPFIEAETAGAGH